MRKTIISGVVQKAKDCADSFKRFEEPGEILPQVTYRNEPLGVLDIFFVICGLSGMFVFGYTMGLIR